MFKKEIDANTIDFSAKYGTNGIDDFSKVMFRKDSTIIDIDHLCEDSVLEKKSRDESKKRSNKNKSLGTIEIPEPPKTMQEDESISIYDRIKRSALKRFSKGHNNYTRYCDLAMKFFMGKSGAKAGKPKLFMSIDMLQKSDAKVFGYILMDFPILESITLWSDVINLPSLERRDDMLVVPKEKLIEDERTKLSQNMHENSWLFRYFTEHIEESNNL